MSSLARLTPNFLIGYIRFVVAALSFRLVFQGERSVVYVRGRFVGYSYIAVFVSLYRKQMINKQVNDLIREEEGEEHNVFNVFKKRKLTVNN